MTGKGRNQGGVVKRFAYTRNISVQHLQYYDNKLYIYVCMYIMHTYHAIYHPYSSHPLKLHPVRALDKQAHTHLRTIMTQRHEWHRVHVWLCNVLHVHGRVPLPHTETLVI